MYIEVGLLLKQLQLYAIFLHCFDIQYRITYTLPALRLYCLLGVCHDTNLMTRNLELGPSKVKVLSAGLFPLLHTQNILDTQYINEMVTLYGECAECSEIVGWTTDFPLHSLHI